METPSSGFSSDQASQVCTQCKTRKRRCDKALPKCSSCFKKNLPCDYLRPEPNRSPSFASNQSWLIVPDHDDRAGLQSIDFPTILFLDPGLLQHGQVEVPQTAMRIPAQIQALIGDIDDIRATASKFFECTHKWMPFISKKRLYDLHLRPSFQSRPDVVLLFLSLKLITTSPSTSPRNPRTLLYHTVKHFYLEVEGSSVFSILVLQAGVLLALYELGHAIYPAAFLSIGACARYAHALGINVSKTLKTKRVLTLVEVEERRRVWWAIVILDRFVSIGCPGRPLVTADPSLDDLLPADDAAWDEGIVRSEDSFRLCSPMTAHMSKFALVCQAARLLGQVLGHISSDSAIQDDVWIQLDRTLYSMVTASLNVDLPDYDQITFIYSALVALYTPWLHSDPVNTIDRDRAQRAKFVIQEISGRVLKNLVKRDCFVGRDPETISIWGLFFAYHICVVQTRSGRETSESMDLVKILKDAFVTIKLRWDVAGVYLQLLEAREVLDGS